MTSSSIFRHFSDEQKSSLAVSISNNLLHDPEDSSLLASLVSELSIETQSHVHLKIKEFIVHAIESGDEQQQEHGLALLKSSRDLVKEIWAFILSKLKASMRNSFDFAQGFEKYLLRPGHEQEVNSGESFGDGDIDHTKSLVSILGFLSKVFTDKELSQFKENTLADELLCTFLGHRDEQIALCSSQLIRWRIDAISNQCLTNEASAEYYWSLLFDLQSSSSTKRHQSNAFVLWLRLLGSTKCNFKTNTHFQNNIISKGFYWQVLQENLVGNSHETRKICLSILQLSLKQINVSFSTPTMKWDLGNENNLLREWSRYTTLFEVLGIDTSLHQTQAAVHDILSIISEDSLIHPSWGFCLLSTGFRASMDSVRRYSAEILFSIKLENLHLLRYGLSFLEHQFLPYLMLSRHFVVRTKEYASTELHCEYGEKYTNFISAVIKSLNTHDEVSEVSFTILSVLVRARETFDAVKIYTCLGLVQGLGDRKALVFGKHDALLLKLFDNFSEGDLFRKAVQTLNLRLLLSFEMTTLSTFAKVLAQFVSYNGQDIVHENSALISGYLADHNVSNEDLIHYAEGDISEEEAVIFLGLACGREKHEETWALCVSKCSDLVIAKLLQSAVVPLPLALQTRATEVFNSALEGCGHESLYHLLSSVPTHISLPECSEVWPVWPVWTQIGDEVTADSADTLVLAFSKLKFLNQAIRIFGIHSLPITIETLLKFREALLVNSESCAKKISAFYKFRQNVTAEFHHLLSSYVELKGLKEGEFAQVLSMLTFETSHHSTLVALVNILGTSFSQGYANDEEITKAILGLSQSLAELDAARFKLSERSLHTSLIKVFFHESVLKCAVSNNTVSDSLLTFAEVIITNSYGRRGLMTNLTKALSDFQVSHAEDFERLPFIPKFLVKAMVHREIQTSVFKLEKVIGGIYDAKIALDKTSDIYYEVYGVDEVAYKVWLMAIVNSIQGSACAQSVLDVVFDTKDPYNFFKVIRPVDGAEEHIRIQLAKLVICLIDKIDVVTCAQHYFNMFMHFVENDPSPLVRVYFEWALALLFLKKPELSLQIFDKLEASLTVPETKPTLVTLYERVLFLMIQSMSKTEEVKYLTKLTTLIVPTACTNKAVMRHFSMSLAMSIFNEIRKKELNIDQELFNIIDNMNKSALATDAFSQFRSGDACLWNIVDDLDLVHISGGLLLRLFDRDVEFIMKDDFHKFLSAKQLDLLTRNIGEDTSDQWVRKLKENSKPKSNLKESSDGMPTSLQTKSGAWSTVMDVDAKTQMMDIKRSELIVVASLVDKPPNLGGICRLCDVLGAGLLTLHDFAVKQNQQFKSVAVTADSWMPMTEVKPDDIVKFLREQKANGYTLIGLEQTDNSVVLDSQLKFPPKSLILLGREKEGIPGELLAELDMCVEIKQVGVVRSMNIQTATAVIVHAYSSQNC